MKVQIEILRTSGTNEEHELHPKDGRELLRTCLKLMGAEISDTVNLRDGRVMIVDDDGWECDTVDHGNGHFEMKPVRARKPVNVAATEIYQKLCRPGTSHQIVGDVVIAWDEDFA